MKAAVLGSPITHSLSPVLHRAAYRALGLDGWTYQAVECDEAGLPGLLAGCGPDWAGLSLTMPLKRAVLPLLDRVEPLAAEVGAANTVIFHAGARHGHNTDVPGMVAALAEAAPAGHGPGVSPPRGVSARGDGSPGPAAAGVPGGVPGGAAGGPGEVLIVGAGATACSALAAIRDLGAREATVAARDPAGAAGLLDAARRLGMAVRLAAFDDPPVSAPAVLVSTVPAGAAGFYAERIASAALHPGLVFDVVYEPWPTPLAAAARGAGVTVVSGFALLLHQAAGQVVLMTGKPAPVGEMRAAGLAALTARTRDALRR